MRRVNYRLNKINSRLEILSGYLIAYLNLDEIIRIIREEEDPKAVMIAKFSLTDNQAEAILNMKLRNLRKLEESEIRKEFDDLTAEKGELEALLADEKLRWQAIAGEIKLIREKFGKKTALGHRRTEFAEVPDDIEVPIEALVEKEPITVILSQKGWIRCVKGHTALNDRIFDSQHFCNSCLHFYCSHFLKSICRVLPGVCGLHRIVRSAESFIISISAKRVIDAF